jgi:hypothetical protein
VAFFFATGRQQRHASREFLKMVLGRRPTVAEQFRHFFGFAERTLDVFIGWAGGIPAEAIRPGNVTACGAIEAWLGIEMQRAAWFPATANLAEVDPRCGALDYVVGRPRHLRAEYLMSNNFAFGGINTSLIFKRL